MRPWWQISTINDRLLLSSVVFGGAAAGAPLLQSSLGISASLPAFRS